MKFINVFKENITKEYLFSKGINQESIMTYYTGTNVNSKKLFLSPFRQDKHVTCSYYKSKSGILYLHDFATNEHINCFEVVMRLYNCNYYKALDIIAKDFGLIETSKEYEKIKNKPKIIDPIKESDLTIIQCQIKDFTDKELEWWNQFGINQKLLKKYHVFSIKHIFLNGELKFTSSETCPIYGYYFGKDKNGLERWKCYFPAKENYRFIGNLSKKILQGYQQLPKTGDLLVITKSMKDCMALKAFNIAACSPNSETLFINDKQLEEFKKRFKHIIVMYDQDRPGKHNMWLIRKQHPELNFFCMPKSLKKDFTDTIKEIGMDKMKELVNNFMSNYKFK